MAEQLASVPEESSTDFTALSPRSYSYRESIWSVAGPGGRIRSTLSSQSGQSGSNHSSISAAGASSSSYLFNISGSASAGEAELGADDLHQGRPSIHKVSSSLAKQLASVSEESSTGSTAPCPPSYSYRESIRSVAWPEWRIRSTLSSQSGQSGSDYSSISGSNISGCSSGSPSADAVDFAAEELTKIAHTMISDGYIQRMVRAFKYGGGGEQSHALETWFIELDISWVLQKRELQDTSASSVEELVERWTRALTIIVVIINQLVAAVNEAPVIGRFGQASISAMLDFVAVFDNLKVEKLQNIVHMYICVSSASDDMCTKHMISSEAQSIFDQIVASLKTEENRLIQKLSSWMWLLKRKLMKKKHDHSWAIDIMRGGAEVHKNTRLMADCIVLMKKAERLTYNSAQSQNTTKLHDIVDDTINYLKDLLLQKSKLCLDPSLRYLFLLNNIYFTAQVSGPYREVYFQRWGPQLLSEHQEYMDSYLEVSWGDVMSCISSSNFLGPIRHWINTSRLAKFQSAFHNTYKAQKFWKVPDPRLRSLLRQTITKKVIPDYRNYLKEHPELEVGSNNPDVFEKMLGELFEG